MNLKMKIFVFAILSIFIVNLFLIAPVAQAQDPYGLNITANSAKITTDPAKSDLITMTGNVINWGLGFLGMIFLVLILIGGFHWMTSVGNEEKITKAKMMINASITGLIVVFLAYALASAIITSLVDASGT